MKIDSLFILENASMKKAMQVIDKCGVRLALVVDNDHKLKGIVTDGDIRRGILRGLDVKSPVIEVMNRKPHTLKVDVSEGKLSEEIHNFGMGIPLLDGKGMVKDLAISVGKKLELFNGRTLVARHLERVLVIGGAGYIGSVLVRKLLKKGYKVNVLDTFLFGEQSLKGLESDDLQIFRGDTRHIEDITAAIRGVDAVVHLAELVGDPACALNPALTQEFNYLATSLIAKVCKHYQINRLVYMSSCSVYGASKGDNLLTEESSLNPVSLYAKMKIASEKALNDMRDDNFLPTILRLGTVFGFSPRPRFDLVVNILTAKALKEGEITIFGGDQWRPNVHVADVADTILAVLEAPIGIVGGQVFNVGTEENNHTIDEIGQIVKAVLPSAEIVRTTTDADRRDYKVDFTKLRTILGVSMRLGVQEGVKEIKLALENDPALDYTDTKCSNIAHLKGWVEKSDD